MERNEVHALTAAYALDALDEVEEREYEAHLRGCDHCRTELTDLTETATSLAYALDAPAPPAALRGRILEQARSERSNVIPFPRRRRALPYVTSAIAAAAAVVAVAVGLWAASLSNRLDEERELLRDPNARVVALSGADGRLVVTPSGRAALVLDVPPAPEGRTYEAWVIEGETPVRAGLFDGRDENDFVELEETVPPGAIVAVTVERAGGVDAPTQTPSITAQT